MKLPEICIRRPVLSIVMSVVLTLIGVVCWSYLLVRPYPQIEQPILSVKTIYDGAGAEIIENQVTKPLEEELSRIEGLDYMTSSSVEGESTITMTFRLDRSLDAAASDVRDRLGRIKRNLPLEARDPILKKSESDASPIIYLAAYSDARSTSEVADFVRRSIQPMLETLDGVASVDTKGAGEYTLRVWIDPLKINAFQISAADVFHAIKKAHIERHTGRIVGKDREYNVSTAAGLGSIAEFNDLVIPIPGSRHNGQNYVRLSEVASVELFPEDDRSRSQFNGKNAVSIPIIKKSEASPLQVAKSVYKTLPKIERMLPPDIKLEIAYDKSQYIQGSIDSVYEAIAVAIILVILVVFGFLGSFRAAIIPLVAIPVSLIGVFALLYAADFSINNLTLLALVLAVGLVVDDAIVVLENIYRHIEEGMSPLAAALRGSKEISFAILAMTITSAAVYAPIALSRGMTGRLFTEFALTLSGAVLISGFVALTLSPMMCSRLLRVHDHTSRNAFMDTVNGLLDRLENTYMDWLNLAMRQRPILIMIATTFSIIGFGVGSFYLGKELAPQEDQGVITSRGYSPQGATMSFMEKYLGQADAIFDSIPEINNRFLSLTSNEFFALMTLLPPEQRSQGIYDIMKSVEKRLKNIPGFSTIYVSRPRSFTGGGKSDDSLQFVLRASDKSLEELNKAAMSLLGVISKNKGLTNVYFNSLEPVQDYAITFNRDLVTYLGHTVEDVAYILEIFTKGKRAGDYNPKGDNRKYEIVVGVKEEFRRSANDLKDVVVRGTGEGRTDLMMPLSSLIQVNLRGTPPEVSHFDRMRSVGFSATLVSGYSMDKAVQEIEDIVYHKLGRDYSVEYQGETRKFIQESTSILMIFALAIAFIFLVMAAQFESFVDPFIIMFSVPLSIAGAILTLAFVPGGSLNIFSYIGIITLIGLITKHGILIIDVANKLRLDHNIDRVQAVCDASRLRFRPILMTTFAMVLGAVPLGLSSGPGAELRQQLGWVIVGGMTVGTFFTLFVVPVVYTYLSRKVFHLVDPSAITHQQSKKRS